jgi:hypothetical protein
LISNEDRFKHIWEYLARRGVGKDTIGKFNIGYAPPYSDERHQGRALIAGFFPLFEKDYGAFNAFSDGGLVRLLNDGTVKGYGYYCRQIDFRRKDPFSRNYGDYFAGRIVFPIYDADACPTGFVGRRPDDRAFAGSNTRPEKSLFPQAGFMALKRQGGISGSTDDHTGGRHL